MPKESPQLGVQLGVLTPHRMLPRNAAWFPAPTRLCPGSTWKAFTPLGDVDTENSSPCNMKVHYQLEKYFCIIELYLDPLHWSNQGDSCMLDFWESCLPRGKTWGAVIYLTYFFQITNIRMAHAHLWRCCLQAPPLQNCIFMLISFSIYLFLYRTVLASQSFLHNSWSSSCK